MRRHVIENAYSADSARFPPSTVPENGSSPQTRDASRSIIKTQTAVVNSATSVFLGKSLVSAFWPNTSSDWMNLAKTYRRAARVFWAVSLAGCQRPTLQLTKR